MPVTSSLLLVSIKPRLEKVDSDWVEVAGVQRYMQERRARLGYIDFFYLHQDKISSSSIEISDSPW